MHGATRGAPNLIRLAQTLLPGPERRWLPAGLSVHRGQLVERRAQDPLLPGVAHHNAIGLIDQVVERKLKHTRSVAAAAVEFKRALATLGRSFQTLLYFRTYHRSPLIQ